MAARKRPPDIRAAGAVVWRVRKRKIEVAVIHRARYDDWSLPKGKLQPQETELAAAVREVREETGAHIAVTRRLDVVNYEVKGARKQVTYWLARHVGGDFTPNDEVDELDWLTIDAARARVTRAADVAVLDELHRFPIPEAVVILVRHAKAGKRSEWDGADTDRPLEVAGRRQAAALVDFLLPFAPDTIVSAEPARCVQTVEPLARRLGLPIRIEPAFGDIGFTAAPDAADRGLAALARHGEVSVVCSQGVAIPGVLDRVWPRRARESTAKGTAWVLSYVDGTLLSADHYPDASCWPRPST